MKAQDQDHTYDTERILSVVLSMNEQSHYKQEKTKTRPKMEKLKHHIFNIREDKGFAAVLAVLVTGAPQSRQHVLTSLIHIDTCKSPTKSLFDAGSSRISIFIVNT
uniref:Uncharacterized protein n=1 Tax=Tanacetum cinerariifolium TaxID=118510 RepID=A0A699JS26_TANCI|nr:hypothetical protein [Tanacetum cinerariifolium]